MNTMILAQDGSIVNAQAMQQFYAIQIDIEDEETGAPIFGIVAVPFGVSSQEDEKKVILAMYRTEEDCDAAFTAFKTSFGIIEML
ncbi:MAG: hypothetical protein LUC50_04345 [Ruminococcus sp.]|nr:hypothetical protein [Ruminococcus sp.]